MKILVFGASSTIAFEVEKIWSNNQNELVLVGRDESKLNRIANDLKIRGAKQVYTYIKDLLHYEDADEFVNSLWIKHSGFDVVFMAHGVLGEQRSDEKKAVDTVQIINANFVSHAAFLTPIANLMEKQGYGKIAVITSVAGDRGKQSNYIYCSAKAAKIAFLSGLRNRLFPAGISVTELRLGFVETAMTEHFKKGALWAKPDKIAKCISSSIDNKKDIVYLPKIWFFIMLIIKNIPEFLFKKLKM